MSSRPRSWNHRIHRMPFDQEQQRAKLGWTCSTPRCDERAKWTAAYDYVTGKAGRVSWAERHYCDGHGQAFAKKHDLELVEQPERGAVPSDGGSRLFDEIRGAR